MVFSGNPGTGKTTVARILADIFRGLGILTKGHLVETDRAGLVAEYAGQTATKTERRVEEALDGILFIDEAYGLIDSEADDPYGREAVQTLLKRMEDHRKRLVVILAGYTEPIEQLLKSNPGLTSRVGNKLDFPDYSPSELHAIYCALCEEHQYVLMPEAALRVLRGLVWLHDQRDEHFGNARLVRNAFERTIRRMATRIVPLAPITHELLTEIHAVDVCFPDIDDQAWIKVAGQSLSAKFACPQCACKISATDSRVLQQQNCPKCAKPLALTGLTNVVWESGSKTKKPSNSNETK
jgi:adenylate kinase family enzyme